MVKYLIFNNAYDAQVRNLEITYACLPHWSDNVTSKYCEVLKHPEQELYAVIVDLNYTQHFTPEELENSVELSSDWKPILKTPIEE